MFDGHPGDLDNRLKVLFDALRMPDMENELPEGAQPTDDQYPLFCLLQDDKLITAVRMESERLLDVPPGSPEVKLAIRVTVKTQRLTQRTLGIGGDD
jgi:hypothetical protein